MLEIKYAVDFGTLTVQLKLSNHPAKNIWWHEGTNEAPLPQEITDKNILAFWFFWRHCDPHDDVFFSRVYLNKESIKINGNEYAFEEWTSWLEPYDITMLQKASQMSSEHINTCLKHVTGWNIPYLSNPIFQD